MQCVYASLPQGCGNTIHCQGCTIKNTVMDTFANKKPHINVSAYQDIKVSDEEVKRMFFSITTEKINEVVVLRVNEMNEAQKVNSTD